MNWLLPCHFMISSIVMYCVSVCQVWFSVPEQSYAVYARFAFLPELSISQDCMGNLGDGFWDPSRQGCQQCIFSSKGLTLLHIHLGCRYLFREWRLYSLHVIYSYNYMLSWSLGHFGPLTTSWQDLKDRADSFRSMQSEARKRHVSLAWPYK